MGDALVDGFSVVQDPEFVRRRIGFMPDSNGTYPYCSCIEYLDFFARSYGLQGRKRQDAISRVLDFTRMESMADKPTTGLSKGMKQRLCLGRALIHDPSVLIFDEPAAGLDPRARIELKEMVGSLKTAGKALLISSHILTELAEMCDKVLIIEQGRLLASGTVDEILHSFTGESQESTEHRSVGLMIDVVERRDELIAWMQAREFGKVTVNGSTVEILISDDPNIQAELLRELVQAGFPVHRFSAKKRTLEEAFLRVTKGQVQ
jgi:ABC-2 type transport system ATP-binding protein